MGCLNCGKDLVNTPGKKAKKFCNTSCRSGYSQREKRKNSGIEKRKPGRPPKGKISPELQDEIAENNKPENKARILKERHTIVPLATAIDYPTESMPQATYDSPRLDPNIIDEMGQIASRVFDGISRISNTPKEELEKQIAAAKQRVSTGMSKKKVQEPKQEPPEGSNAFYLRYGAFYKKDILK